MAPVLPKWSISLNRKELSVYLDFQEADAIVSAELNQFLGWLCANFSSCHASTFIAVLSQILSEIGTLCQCLLKMGVRPKGL